MIDRNIEEDVRKLLVIAEVLEIIDRGLKTTVPNKGQARELLDMAEETDATLLRIREAAAMGDLDGIIPTINKLETLTTSIADRAEEILET